MVAFAPVATYPVASLPLVSGGGPGPDPDPDPDPGPGPDPTPTPTPGPALDVQPRDMLRADYEMDADLNASPRGIDMARKTWSAKDPDEIRNRGFNWTPRNIGRLQIVSISCQVQSGNVQHVSSSIGTVRSSLPGQGTVHRFSGGTSGETCKILLTATLSDGQVLQQTVYLPIRNI